MQKGLRSLDIKGLPKIRMTKNDEGDRSRQGPLGTKERRKMLPAALDSVRAMARRRGESH